VRQNSHIVILGRIPEQNAQDNPAV
jgi:hypothetical protein